MFVLLLLAKRWHSFYQKKTLLEVLEKILFHNEYFYEIQRFYDRKTCNDEMRSSKKSKRFLRALKFNYELFSLFELLCYEVLFTV